MNTTLWIIQGILAFIFLMAGSMKMIMPKDKLREKIGDWVDDYKISNIKLIGLSEVLGAFGLILPELFNILPFLTPVAAFCLNIPMIGAAQIHYKRNESIVMNIILFLLLSAVIIGRIYLSW